jgi:DnaJ-domain-containing protein 1
MEVPAGQRLEDVLNAAGGFLAWKRSDGAEVLVNRDAVEAVEPAGASAPEQLARHLSLVDELDPAAVLGVSPEASEAAVRAAYHALAQRYHPDRFAGIDMPAEMSAYVNAMFGRINAAYRALQARKASASKP